MTTQEKEAYFATHWGLEVLMDTDNSGQLKTYPVCPSNMYRIEESHLQLTPLESITQEDALEVARKFFPLDIVRSCMVEERKGMILLHISKKGNYPGSKYFTKVKYLDSADYYRLPTDFLRSRGYALPWGPYSLEHLIEVGALKLKEL